VVPYDAACALVAIHDATGRFGRAMGDRFFRGLSARVEAFLARQGAFIGEPATAERLLRQGNLLLDFPGGARDMERSYFTEPYRVGEYRGWAAGRGGFVKLALRTRSPIIPMAVVGTEEVHVMITNAPRLARLLRVPFFPLVLSLLPLPAKFVIRFGRPIELRGGPSDAADQRKVDRWTARVRRDLQALIDDTLQHRRGVILGSYAGRSVERGRPTGHPRRASAR
jgi:1-acyl-sn-glycerol-3-phosphate acyltransferase